MPHAPDARPDLPWKATRCASAQIVPLHQAIPPRLHGGTERAAPRVRSTARRRAEDCLAACQDLAPRQAGPRTLLAGAAA